MAKKKPKPKNVAIKKVVQKPAKPAPKKKAKPVKKGKTATPPGPPGLKRR